MAHITSAVTFTGQVGNLIGYKRNGKYCLRSRPGQVRQSAATRRAAKAFGAASRKGALIRRAIAPDLDVFSDGMHVNRMNTTVMQAGLDNHAAIAGYRFNAHADIGKFFNQLPTFAEDGTLTLPAQALFAHNGCKRIEVKLIASRIDFAHRRVTKTDTAVLDIDLEKPFYGAAMSVDVAGSGTLFVTLQVRLYMEDGVTVNRKFSAADIIAVIEAPPAAAAPLKATARKQLKRLLKDDPAKRLPPPADKTSSSGNSPSP